MSVFKDLISSIDPTATNKSPAPGARQTQTAGAPKPIPRLTGSTNGTSQSPALKRKASGPVDSGQNKAPRKDVPTQSDRVDGAARPVVTPVVAKPNPPTSSTKSVPYRGTAGLGVTKSPNVVAKRPSPAASSLAPASKPSAPPPAKPVGVIPSSAAASAASKKGGYMAMLMKAKEKDLTKPPTPPVKHAPTKVLTKKEREALRAEAIAAAKGKKSTVVAPAKGTDAKADAKGDAAKEKRKAPEMGYQGTARPIKKPAEVGYKGTARPGAATGSAGRSGAGTSKPKPKLNQGRYGGYASWSDEELEDEDEEEEENYDSDGSSDMEAGAFDLYGEEQLALRAAKKEDAEALAEEERHKREKLERKRRLDQMAKAAASRRRI